jgi:ankyrin repeat protein
LELANGDVSGAGGEIGSLSTGGDAPLHLAAECGHVAACSALLALGADVNLPGKDGLTALQR